jgi:succinyl-CoA synthetase alpha subunit
MIPKQRLSYFSANPEGIIEEKLSEIVMAENNQSPIIAFVAGRFGDNMPGIRFGHAATIVEGNYGTTKSKISMFNHAGIQVAQSFSDIVRVAFQRKSAFFATASQNSHKKYCTTRFL